MISLFNPRSPTFMANPYDAFRELRDDDPVHWSGDLGGWVLTRFADVKEALSASHLSADRISSFMKNVSDDKRGDVMELCKSLGMWAVFCDPPKHRRLRGLMNKGFTPQTVERLRPRIHEIVEELLDKVESRGRMDLISALAYPLPVTVISEMVGVASADLEQFKIWSDEIGLFVGNSLTAPDKHRRAERNMIEMSEYMRGIVRDRRANPQDDIMSSLIAAEERGDALSEDEIIASCILMVFAGHETTTHMIGNGMLALLRNPDQLALLRNDPSLNLSAIEEIMRYDGPIMAIVRIATSDFELHGRTIKSGQRIFCMINAANRDPRQYDEPEKFDIRRGDHSHLGFGFGIHYCIGAPLARLETQIAISGMLRRLPDLKLENEELDWLDSLVVRGVAKMPLKFRPRAGQIASLAET